MDGDAWHCDTEARRNSRRKCRFKPSAALGCVLVATAACLVTAGEEDKPTAVATAVSVMLLGSIGFQMLLFYLVNHPDEDIKRYSWQVLSKTISIFCAVLLFQACNGLVEYHVIESKTGLGSSKVAGFFGDSWAVVIDNVHLLLWLIALQVVLAITSGAVGQEPANGMEGVELNMKSYSVLFSHIAGFASINAWGSLQQVFLNSNPFIAILAVPIGFVGLFGVFFAFDLLRDKIAKSDDGEVDEYEAKWDEETEEAENDVAGLSLSFLTVQVIRFAISDKLPNQEGLEEGDPKFSMSQWGSLLVCGLVFEVIAVLVNRAEGRVPHEAERLKRAYSVANNYFSFGNSWCFFYAVRWAIVSSSFTSEPALLPVCIALFLSAVSFLFIWILDKIEDNQLFGAESEEGIDLIIQGLGVLVGFSWEQCFDVAVTVVASSCKHTLQPPTTKLLLSVLLVLIVFPAWRIYILKTEQELIEETTERGLKDKKIKHLLGQHGSLILDEDCDEHLLDLAHLKMKQKRRNVHGRSHPAVEHGLKYCTVTAAGIHEVDEEHFHGHGAGHGHGHVTSNAKVGLFEAARRKRSFSTASLPDTSHEQRQREQRQCWWKLRLQFCGYGCSDSPQYGGLGLLYAFDARCVGAAVRTPQSTREGRDLLNGAMN